ncbi:hypothetical protein GDO81_029671 [Engystomops pustulosus]|uniref:Uncharacterized protein n=1 Tax=Engystomops pustulosus TaxID=76066 RepID=A0AAV6YV04_ENGPU|nr:hypothetical protein GDO81_029671 [Engystomops pustulosus]
METPHHTVKCNNVSKDNGEDHPTLLLPTIPSVHNSRGRYADPAGHKEPSGHQSQKVGHGKCTSGQTRRAKAFHPKEVHEIVRYLDYHGYENKPKRNVHWRKASILQKLARLLTKEFGTHHSPRQIQKRYSDLKVREMQMLTKIRRRIASGEITAPIEPSDKARSQGVTDQREEPSQNSGPNVKEIVTLNLQPIGTDDQPEEVNQQLTRADLGQFTSEIEQHFSHEFAGESASGQTRRAKAFHPEELQEIVRYLDYHGYEDLPKRNSHCKKASILQNLARHLSKEFGTHHSPRQIQKRYSDLKVREKRTLGKIRRQIALDKKTAESDPKV